MTEEGGGNDEEAPRFFIAVHVGAGYHAPSNEKSLRKAMNRACLAAATILRKGDAGGCVIDAVSAAIQVLEDDPSTNAGRGSNLTEDGNVECDASVMDGTSGAFGAEFVFFFSPSSTLHYLKPSTNYPPPMSHPEYTSISIHTCFKFLMASGNTTVSNTKPNYQLIGRLPREFSYADLKKATCHFSKKLGGGMSGSVFEGLLEDGSRVAVKRVDGAKNGRQMFETEISMIASLQHVNLVGLRGFGCHTTETGKAYFFIIYRLLSNGSLDTWIFPGSPGGRYLSWKQRYAAAIDVARALVYLHDYCLPPIYHLDIKPANILVNDKFQAVLSDFGLSKLTNEDGSDLQSINVRGTRGYMAPELIRTNQMSSKCDIYSYGKVLFDLFFGQMYVILNRNGEDIYDQHFGNSSHEERTFLLFLRQKWNEKDIMQFLDKRLKLEDGMVNELEAYCLVDVAIRCVNEDPKRRPHSMQKVLHKLEAGKKDKFEVGNGDEGEEEYEDEDEGADDRSGFKVIEEVSEAQKSSLGGMLGKRQLLMLSNQNNVEDGIPWLRKNIHKSRSTKPRPTGGAKEISLLSRASSVVLGKAVNVLDTLGSRMTNLTPGSGFVLGTATKGNEISILAFEVANTIVKGCKLMQSLSKENVRDLKERVLISEGVQCLVSKNFDEVVRIAAADKREELKVFSGEVVRFGDRCKDPQWHNLQRYFEKLHSELIPPKHLKKEAQPVMQQLMTLVQFTAELYHELHALDRFEQDYRRKLQEDLDSASVSHKGDNLNILKTELKSQNKHVQSLKKKSLWSKMLEEVMEKLVDIVDFLHLEIHDAFDATVGDRPAKSSLNNRILLGPAGLALHYANIVTQIDTIVGGSTAVAPNTRDTLYQGLPPSIKSALRPKRKSFQVDEELTIPKIKEELEKTLQWLAPIANNTTKAYHGFDWVREWASTGYDGNKKQNSHTDIIRLETLHHADKEKTEVYILDLVVWLHHLVSLSRAANGIQSR